MTARSRKQRDRNARIKRDRNKIKELKRLKKTLGLIDKDGNELMDDVKDLVDEKQAEELKQKQAEKLILEEFVEEKKQEIEESGKKKKKNNKRKMHIKNSNTGKMHVFDTKSMKDQYGSYPPWLNVGNHKRKMKRKKSALKKDQFYTGAILPV